MDLLDNYFINNKNNIIYQNDIFNEFKNEYDDTDDLMVDVNFLLNTIYTNVSIIPGSDPETNPEYNPESDPEYNPESDLESNRERHNQSEFRKKVIERYGKCIITGVKHETELEAAHIIPYASTKSCELDNGILLNRMIHKTFDNYEWSINPDTLKIEIRNSIRNDNNSTILKSDNNQKIDINENSIEYLKDHYNKFTEFNDG